jgi:YbgC/YbaW family acyl-CoA thioester hydrolase
MLYKRFETELIVRPDDIDMNNHVHNSKYLDYVLFARYDQMGRCYGMPMDEFISQGWAWYVKACYIEFKRPLNLETVLIRTWLDSFEKADVKVGFQIFKKSTMKIASEGHFINTMVSLNSGRAEVIPDWVIQRYAQHVE